MKPALKWIVLAALTAPFWDLGHPLWEVDDARYAEVPREMHEGGDWLTPQLNYVDYIEKPPLIYWLGAASYGLFGVSEAAGRLPHALMALLGIAGVWWLGAWLYSAWTGTAAALILASCLQYAGLAHNMTPDMAVTVALLWATGLILHTLRRPKKSRWTAPLAWVAMAMALLSKGLIGIVLPGAWTLFILWRFPETRRSLKTLLFNWGPPTFAVIIGGWFWAMEQANPGFFNVFVIEQHFQRFLDTAKYNRPAPWYFFLLVELVGCLPWSPLVAAAVIVPILRWKKADPRDVQLAAWVVLVLGFFSASSSKLLTYILPLFPQQALLAARFLTEIRNERKLDRYIARVSIGLGSLVIAAGLIGPLVARSIKTDVPIHTALVVAGAFALFALGSGLLALGMASRAEQGKRVVLMVTAAALITQAMLVAGTRQLTDHLSVRKLALEINARAAKLPAGVEPRIICYDSYLHGIPFYTGLPADVVNWVGEMHYAKRFKRYQHRFGDDNAIRALPQAGKRVYVTLKAKHLKHLLSLNPKEEVARVDYFGPWALVEY